MMININTLLFSGLMVLYSALKRVKFLHFVLNLLT